MKYKVLSIKYLVSIFSLFSYFLLASTVEAAVLELRGPSQVAVGEKFLVSLYLNTEGAAINALEGEINLTGQGFEVASLEEGNSIISLWLLRPTATGKVINFAGIIPGGFQSVLEAGRPDEEAGKILGVLLEAKAGGQLSIAAGVSRLAAHDGASSLIDVVGANHLVGVNPALVAGVFGQAPDNEPPEPFRPRLVQSHLIYEGKYSLVFQTRDNSSGIDYYEIKEGEREFKLAESPYLLENQRLDEPILVKAIDRAGNEKIAAVGLPEPGWFDFGRIRWIILVLLIVGSIAIYRWKKASHKYYLFGRR